jgi:hypothetical protein
MQREKVLRQKGEHRISGWEDIYCDRVWNPGLERDRDQRSPAVHVRYELVGFTHRVKSRSPTGTCQAFHVERILKEGSFFSWLAPGCDIDADVIIAHVRSQGSSTARCGGLTPPGHACRPSQHEQPSSPKVTNAPPCFQQIANSFVGPKTPSALFSFTSALFEISAKRNPHIPSNFHTLHSLFCPRAKTNSLVFMHPRTLS